MRPATVPICDECWAIEEPKRQPVRFRETEVENEICYRCGEVTRSGIYTRRMILEEK